MKEQGERVWRHGGVFYEKQGLDLPNRVERRVGNERRTKWKWAVKFT